jgi:peroxiredoxin/mono/diheme cytochrome c family protein
MRTIRNGAILMLAVLAATMSPQASGADQDGETPRVGRQIKDFTLKDQWGKSYSLSDFSKQEAVVVAFLGTECPLAKLYGHRLSEIHEQLSKQGVALLGIASNQQDSIEEIAAFARRHEIEFPILKDPGNAIADRFGAIRTPEVFVLDAKREVRYWGRIDDQYGFGDGVGYQRPEPTRHDLVEAVKEVLQGKDVQVPVTRALGCHIGRVREPDSNAEVTYSNQIARIFRDRCVECHREGRIGPFTMLSYDDVVGWGEMIREVVQQERMPPWHASPKHGTWVNDKRLSDEEKQLIDQWVEAGCPEGDPANLPEPKQYDEGWGIGEPDQIVYMRDRPYSVPAEGVIDYVNLIVDPGWKEDKWIAAAEPKPGSLETVHHILVFLVRPGTSRGSRGSLLGGELIAGYAPGTNPTVLSTGNTALLAPAGSKLHFQLHYTPNGTPQEDRSYIGFKFADPEDVQFEARGGMAINLGFQIPPGDSNFRATAVKRFHRDTNLLSFTPHMHLRGKSFRYEVEYPDGTEEILLDVPRYDFNWQATYQLAEPKFMPKGTKMRCVAHWDNSEENLSNPDPTDSVRFGPQTWHEMLIGFWVQVAPREKEDVQ